MQTVANKVLTGQFLRYGIVGGIAALTHIGVLVTAVEAMNQHPTYANIVAFLFAVIISYTGNIAWTFREHPFTILSFLRFVIVTFVGLCMNVAIFFTIVNLLQLHYLVALLLVVTLTPIVTFVLQRSWTFGQSQLD